MPLRTRFPHRVASATVLACSLALTACDNAAAPSDRSPVDSLTVLPRALTTAELQGVTTNTRFGLSLLRQVATTRSGNVLLSPLSVSYALGMTANGAEQETLTQIMTTLGWGDRPRVEVNTAYRDLAALLPTLDPTVTITLANGVWVRQPLVVNPAFASDVQQFFGAPVQALATPRLMYDSVNAWANRRTQGMLPKVLDGEPRPDLVMLLANATYFAGQWRERFDPALTQPRPFRLESGTTVSVPTMTREGGARTMQTNAFSAIELTYGNTAWSMLLLVPTTQTVGALAASLTDGTLSTILDGLRPAPRSSIFLPRFTVSGSLELSPELGTLGMPRAFTDAAQFPRLVNERTKLSFVQHAVKVAVDERGTKAAGVTVVGVVPVSLPAPLVVDRPFLFMIRERLTGTIAFVGIVRDPR